MGPCPDNHSGICKKGQIMRVGYEYKKKTTKKTVKVKPTCIEDKGKPGKGPVYFKIPKDPVYKKMSAFPSGYKRHLVTSSLINF